MGFELLEVVGEGRAVVVTTEVSEVEAAVVVEGLLEAPSSIQSRKLETLVNIQGSKPQPFPWLTMPAKAPLQTKGPP